MIRRAFAEEEELDSLNAAPIERCQLDVQEKHSLAIASIIQGCFATIALLSNTPRLLRNKIRSNTYLISQLFLGDV